MKRIIIRVILGVFVIVRLINKDGNTNYHENVSKAK